MDGYNEFLDFCLENELTIDSQLHETIKKLFENLNSNKIVTIVVMPDDEKKSIVALLLTLFLEQRKKRALFYSPAAYWEDYGDYEFINKNKESLKKIAFANCANIFFDYGGESFDYIISERLATKDISTIELEEVSQRFLDLVRKRSHGENNSSIPNADLSDMDLECLSCQILAKIATRSFAHVVLFLSLTELRNCRNTMFVWSKHKAIISEYKKEELLKSSVHRKSVSRQEDLYTQKLFAYLDNRFSKIRNETDDIGEILLGITKILRNLQKLIDDDKHFGLFMLEAIGDEKQEENIIQNVVDIVSAHTSAYTNEAMVSVENERLFSIYHRIEEMCMGSEAWEKMGKESRNLLITAKLLRWHGDNVDYSSIDLLASKAIELELGKRFVTGYKAYIRNNLKDDYSKWPSCLVKQDRKGIIGPIDETDYMLGNSQYIMGILPRNSKEADRNAQLFGDYCKKDLIKEEILREIGLKSAIKELNDQIWIVMDKYRNLAACKNTIGMFEDDYSREVESVMKRMLEMFNF